MKVILSSTYDDLYWFNLPIVVWSWNKLGVDCIVTHPFNSDTIRLNKMYLTADLIKSFSPNVRWKHFRAPLNKEATYAQCSRLFGGTFDEIPDDEILITGDADMAVFSRELVENNHGIHIWGTDLVPPSQFPLCYISMSKRDWQMRFGVKGFTLQHALDTLLGDIEADHFRGNYWAKDQETAWKMLITSFIVPHPRARAGTMFASRRVDRDDQNWRSYTGPDLIDAHLWRPGYADTNFANIMELLRKQYPAESFEWLEEYRQKYMELL